MRKSTLLASAFLLLTAGSAQADVIGLTTNKAVGSELTLGLNADLTVRLTWGNGDEETLVSDGLPKTLTIKDASLTITSVSGKLKRFYAPAAGLTALNTSEAPDLQRIICPDNDLAELSLTANTALTELDCQGNDLTTLALNRNSKMEVLNCADNHITTINYTSAVTYRTIVCADNELTTLRYQTAMRNLKSLWCQDNAFETIGLTNSANLRSLCAANNALTSLTLAAAEKLTDVWVENNALTTLDLSAGSPALRALSVDHNALTLIKWDRNCRNSLRYFYGNDNKLLFGSFPTLSSNLTAELTPQAPHPLVKAVATGVANDFTEVLSRTNAFGSAISPTYTLTNAAGETLESGSGGDYTLLSNRWTFNTLQKGVVMTVTSARAYPDITLTTEPFDVTDPTGIGRVEAEGLTVTGEKGCLVVEAAGAARVSAYSAAGVAVVDARVAAGRHTWPVPAGVYVVNGKKVLVY